MKSLNKKILYFKNKKIKSSLHLRKNLIKNYRIFLQKNKKINKKFKKMILKSNNQKSRTISSIKKQHHKNKLYKFKLIKKLLKKN
jgi:hypothetical protein